MASPAFVHLYDDDAFELHERLHTQFLGHRVETDPQGAIHLAAATDEHVLATVALASQFYNLLLAKALVFSEKFLYQPAPGMVRNEPDLIVTDLGYQRVHESGVTPPPLLIAEITSQSTRKVDRSRKMDDYLVGNVGQYLLVDLPGMNGEGVNLELLLNSHGAWVLAAHGPAVTVSVAGVSIRIDGATLVRTKRPPLRSV